MGFEIKPHDEYLEVVFDGLLEKKTVLSSLNQLLNHPEYYSKHSLWNMTGSRLGFSISDFKEIIGVMRLFSPKEKEFSNRSVLLVSGHMNQSMAGLFIDMAGALPFEFSIAAEEREARALLTQ